MRSSQPLHKTRCERSPRTWPTANLWALTWYDQRDNPQLALYSAEVDALRKQAVLLGEGIRGHITEPVCR